MDEAVHNNTNNTVRNNNYYKRVLTSNCPLPNLSPEEALLCGLMFT